MPALAPHATVYANDNLGFGLSPAKDGMNCGLLATSERILQFAAAVGIKDFDILGSSYGGAVAIMAAALAVDRPRPQVRRMILVGPVNPWSPHGKRLAPFVGSALGSVLFRNTIARWRKFDYIWLSRMFGDARKIPPDSLNGYRIPIIKNEAILHGSRVVETTGRRISTHWKKHCLRRAIIQLYLFGAQKIGRSITVLQSRCARTFKMFAW